MSERIHIDRDGEAFRIDIDMPMESGKADEIRRMVEKDAGEAIVTLGHKRRLRRLEAKGLVTPGTMRGILDTLAA